MQDFELDYGTFDPRQADQVEIVCRAIEADLNNVTHARARSLAGHLEQALKERPADATKILEATLLAFRLGPSHMDGI